MLAITNFVAYIELHLQPTVPKTAHLVPSAPMMSEIFCVERYAPPSTNTPMTLKDLRTNVVASPIVILLYEQSKIYD